MDAGSVGLKSRWNAIDEELNVILLVLTAIEPSESAGKDIFTSFIQNGRETEKTRKTRVCEIQFENANDQLIFEMADHGLSRLQWIE